MAYINVDEVYILDNTGLQVDMATDIPFADAGFSDTQKAQARKNIGAGGSNVSLLDNGWFTVNQRSSTSGSSAGYFVDRWKLSLGGGGSVSWSLSSGILTITGTATYLEQKPMDDVSWMVGKTFTLSVMLSDGTIESGTFTRTASTQTIFTGTNYYAYMGSNGFVGLSISGTVALQAVKLELGTTSTLANDTPPEYGTELAKCQRYFVRLKSTNSYCPFGTALGASTNAAYIFVPLSVTLRALPTSVSSSAIAQFSLYGESGDYAMSSISVRGITPNGVTLAGTATGVTTHGTYSFICKDATSYIDISADL